MKKITLLILFLSTLWGYSQVKRYTFTKSTGTYLEISDGTVLGNESSDSQRYVDPGFPLGVTSGYTGVGLPIGFNFTFNGYVYDKFAVATDGWISLGTTALGVNINVTTSSTPLQSTSSVMGDILSAKIAALGKDLGAQTGSSISYQTVGDVVGQRTLVVQWKKYKKSASAGTGDNFNFQIRLSETTNKIDIVYGAMTSNPTAGHTYQVGLRAAPAGNPINFATRNSSTGWDNTVDGTSASDAVLMNDLLVPSNGTTFTWTPPTCGGASVAAVSSITTNGATLIWGAYTPAPDSFEYIVSTSATMPLSTDSGTTTTTSTVVLSTLNPSTVYNVFLRTKCGSEFTPWILGCTFKTLCLDATTFYEDFDSYTASTLTLPDCWAKAGTGSANAYISSASISPMSSPNMLYTFGSSTAVSYTIMPVVSNLGAGTNRLKFKAYGTVDHATFDVGYFTDITNPATFTSIQTITLIGIGIDKTQQFIVIPDAISNPSVKNLVFRNQGSGTSFLTVFIDNVVWEPNSVTCPDVADFKSNGISSASINLSWTPGGSEKKWEYVYGLATVQNPYTLTPIETSITTFTLNSLSVATKYKVWVRSKCSDTDFGAWIGPVAFSTTCTPVSQFMDNFDASNSVLPSCWAKVGSAGSVYPTGTTGASPNALYLNTSASLGVAVVTLPPVSNAGAGTNRLRFKTKSNIAQAKLDVGYLTDVSDPSSFQLLETITLSSNTTSFDNYIKFYGADPKSPNLAFRNPGPSAAIFLDDIAWEPIPTCPDVSGIATTAVTSVSVGLTWTAGGSENAWQYAVGSVTSASPFFLTPVDVSSSSAPLLAIINGLTPATTYKVWMRSKCAGNNFGAWMGPVNFATTCASGTSFSESFDVGTALPVCWSQVGITGLVKLSSETPPVASSGINSLYLGTNSSSPAICAMPPVSNAGAGTYRLRFKYKASVVGAVLEVGYMVNPSDPTAFSSLKSYTATQSTSFEAQTAILGMDPTTDVLAFRNAGSSTTIYIDDVIWEPIPTCLDVKNVVATGVTGSSIVVDWDAGGSETNWQYAIGSPSLLEPSTLTPVDVPMVSAVTISGLSPVTSYKIWVRSKCSSASLGDWSSPITVTTVCAAVDSFTQNFDAIPSGNSNGSSAMPDCWNKVGDAGKGFVYSIGGAPSGGNVLNLFSVSGDYRSIVAMPPISNAATGDHVLKFKYSTDTLGCILEVGYLTNPIDPTSFIPFSSITTDNTNIFKLKILSLGSSPMSNILAFRNTGAVKGSVYIDDVSWASGPTTVPTCATGVIAVPNANCGNYATSISWTAVAGADGYKLTVGTTSGGYDVLNAFDTNPLSYSLVAPVNTTYYYTVVPYNNFGPATGCAEKTFTTSPNKCYCLSVPTAHDDQGIVNITLGGSSFAGSNKNYYDLTSKPVNLAQGANVNMPITFNTNGNQYKVAVYVDLNDNYIFESTEVVYSGLTGSGTPKLNIVDASFMMPATASLGIHSLRICSVDKSYTIDPCLSAGLGITADLKVNVLAPVGNDEASGAIALTVGANFTANAITGTNVNSTGSIIEPDPGCGNYNGNDVWYSAVVPTSGNLTFEVNSVSGGITNNAAVAYGGSIGSLAFISCDDSSSTAGDDQPKISLTGRTAGEVIYFRVWANGGNAFGTFKVSAYDASMLGVNSFDEINFSYYPNPVNDVLNLSFNQEMTNVTVLNLLGQQLMSKSLNANQGKIDMSHLSSGTYLVRVTVGNQLKTIKVVKE